MKKFILISTIVGALAVNFAQAAEWEQPLQKEVTKIDDGFDGNMGVFVQRLTDKSFMNHQGDRAWYLASTTKVLIAVSVLKEVEKGSLKLDQKITLKQSDYVDGSGKTISSKPGAQFTVSQLIDRMMRESDSTATDMLVNLLGGKLDTNVKELAPKFGKITKIVAVRFDAYSQLHPSAKNLTNMDFIEFRKFPAEQRAQVFAKKINVPLNELKYPDAEAAFEAYYKTGSNSGSLVEFATILINLSEGKLLNPKHTDMLLNSMAAMTTGEKRIKTGLPKSIKFAQKTGTQIARICNVGIIYEPGKIKEGVVVTACAEKFKDQDKAEVALGEVGKSIASLVLKPNKPAHK